MILRPNCVNKELQQSAVWGPETIHLANVILFLKPDFQFRDPAADKSRVGAKRVGQIQLIVSKNLHLGLAKYRMSLQTGFILAPIDIEVLGYLNI